MNARFIVAVVVAAVLNFLGGWLVWGILLQDFYNSHTLPAAAALNRAEEDMIFWALIVGHFAWAGLIVWVVDRTGSRSAMKGAITGGIVMFLTALGVDLYFYAMMEMFDGVGIIVADVSVNTIFWMILGAVTGWILGRGSSAS